MAKVRKSPFVLLVVILCHSAFSLSTSEYLTAESKLLLRTAIYISEQVDPYSDECQQFAKYVENEFDINMVTDYSLKYIENTYINNIRSEESFSRANSKVNDFYESCALSYPNTYLDALADLNIARNVLEFKTLHRFGPTVYGEDTNLFTWSKLIGVLQDYDITAFVSGYATASEHGTMTFHLAPGKFDLTQTEFWNGDLKSVLQYYGLDDNEIFDLIRSLEEFERKFSARETPRVKTNMTIGDLQNKFPNFEWVEYFQLVANTNKDINEFRQVTVTDLEKIEEYYHAHSFPELTETAVTYYFLKLQAKLNLEYYAVKKDRRMCLIKTFTLFKEVFANAVLQTLTEQDEANLKDTVVSVMNAVSKMANWDTRWAIDAEMEKIKNEPSIATQQEEFKEYVGGIFPFFTNEGAYLSNYLRAYSCHRTRQTPAKYQKYLDRIGFYYNVHDKPRLVLLATVGYQVAYGTLKQYNVRMKQIAREHCQAFFDGIAPYRAILDAVDYLEEQDPEKYQNEVAVLKDYHFDPKKIVHILYGKILVGQNKGTDRSVLSKIFLQVQDFRKSYGCSAPSELSHGCYV